MQNFPKSKLGAKKSVKKYAKVYKTAQKCTKECKSSLNVKCQVNVQIANKLHINIFFPLQFFCVWGGGGCKTLS